MLEALDHDFNVDSICPSVLLLYAPGEDGAADSTGYYDGHLYVYLKDAIMNPSSHLRHAAETLKSIRLGQHEGLDALILRTDGGPDRNVTYVSTKVCMLALALILDVDCLIAHRTTPGQSYVNQVERCMSLLNLSLYGVALERGKCSNDVEKVLQRHQSMASRRKAINKADGFDPDSDPLHNSQGPTAAAFAQSMQVCNTSPPCAASEVFQLYCHLILHIELMTILHKSCSKAS